MYYPYISSYVVHTQYSKSVEITVSFHLKTSVTEAQGLFYMSARTLFLYSPYVHVLHMCIYIL